MGSRAKGMPSGKERRMYDRVTERIASQKLPGTISDEPLIPLEKSILDWTDAGDAMQLIEAGNMVANGQILPGAAMAGLTLLPRTLAEPVNRALRKTVGKAARNTDEWLRRFASENGLVRMRDAESGHPVFATRSGDVLYLRDGQLYPVDAHANAGTVYPGEGRGYYVEPVRAAPEPLPELPSEMHIDVSPSSVGHTVGSDSLPVDALPSAPPEIINVATGYSAPVGAAANPQAAEFRTRSGRLVEPGMDITGMSYDDMVGILNDMSSHTDTWLEDAGLPYSEAATLRQRIQHAIDHGGEDLFTVWGRMDPYDVVDDARRMYPGLAEDILGSYGRSSGRMQDLLDAVEYKSAEDVLGLGEEDLLGRYTDFLGYRFTPTTSSVGSGSPAYFVQKSTLNPFEEAQLSGISKVLNRKLGRKAGVDFTKASTVNEMASIQKALRDKGLVSVDTELPLDIAHMSYFSGNTDAMSDAGRRALRTVDEQPSGTANLVYDTSTASTPMRPGIAAKRYGAEPGRVTVRFKESHSDPSGYLYLGTNDYDHGFDVAYDHLGNLQMGHKLEANIRNYVDPDFDAAKYNFTPDEYSLLQSPSVRTMHPDLYQRWYDMTRLADQASIGPMWKYQDALQNAMRKSGIPGTEDFVVPKARLFPRQNSRFTPVYQPGYQFPWMGIYKNRLGGYLHRLDDGGPIHIKPSHRGRLTELKARTGKTESELYNDGNPAHKKMVVFARNARKWKHGDGGYLYDIGGPLGFLETGFKETNKPKEKKKKFDKPVSWYVSQKPDMYPSLNKIRPEYLDQYFTIDEKGQIVDNTARNAYYTKKRQVRDNTGSIGYNDENEIMLTTDAANARYRTGRISTDILDYIYDNAAKAGVPLRDVLGLAGKESTLGIGRGYKRGVSIAPIDVFSFWAGTGDATKTNKQMDTLNDVYKRLYAGEEVSPEELTNAESTFQILYDKLHDFEGDNLVKAAYDYYKAGKYNPGEKGYNEAVLKHGDAILSDPAVQRWLKTKKTYKGRGFAGGGTLQDKLRSVYGDNFEEMLAAVMRAKNVKKN